MNLDEWMAWADDHGYQHYRCPHCGTHFWSDCGGPGNCPNGCENEEDKDRD